LNFRICEHKISTGKKLKTKRLWSKKIRKSEEKNQYKYSINKYL
jgi:hypothetical protein